MPAQFVTWLKVPRNRVRRHVRLNDHLSNISNLTCMRNRWPAPEELRQYLTVHLESLLISVASEHENFKQRNYDLHGTSKGHYQVCRDTTDPTVVLLEIIDTTFVPGQYCQNRHLIAATTAVVNDFGSWRKYHPIAAVPYPPTQVAHILNREKKCGVIAIDFLKELCADKQTGPGNIKDFRFIISRASIVKGPRKGDIYATNRNRSPLQS